MEKLEKISKYDKYIFRIQNQDGTILNKGTDKDSWFNLDTARKLVDRSKGQKIVEHDGTNILWEIL